MKDGSNPKTLVMDIANLSYVKYAKKKKQTNMSKVCF
jgi:hypothetical protein